MRQGKRFVAIKEIRGKTFKSERKEKILSTAKEKKDRPMTNDIYDPLDEYVNTFRPKFERVARETFAELAKEAQVDVEANHETCSRLYDTED